MKKILLGTTALVAASAFAVPGAHAETAISGNIIQQFVAPISQDQNNHIKGLGSYQNAEIKFTGSSDLDNGMTAAFTVDFNPKLGQTNKAVTADELRFSLSDDWGSIQVGSDDSAMDLVSSWVPGAGISTANSGTYSQMVNSGNVYTGGPAQFATYASLVGDSAGVWYFSPDMNGFKFGTSYQTGTNEGTSSNGSQTNNIFSAGAVYGGSMNDVSYELSLGMDHGTGYNNNNATAGKDNTRNLYRAQGHVGFGGFMVGAGYAATNYDTSTTAKVDQYTLALGASYNTGPHTIGLEWTHSKTDTSATASQKGDIYGINYQNALGGGVTWEAGVLKFDVTGTNSSATTDDTDATVASTALKIGF